MHTISPDRRKRQRGSALVEAGLTMVVFLTGIFGLMDFARMVWAYNLVSHAAREATRYAMVHGRNSSHPASTDDIRTVVNGQAVGLDPSAMQVNVSWIPNNRPGSAVKVALQYSFNSVTHFVGSNTLSST